MVMAVMGGSPKRPLLPAGTAQEGQDELENPAGLVGAVGKVTVVNTRDGEHPDVIHEKAHGNRGPANSGENGANPDHVHTKEGDAAAPVNLLVVGELAPHGFGGLRRRRRYHQGGYVVFCL